MIYFGRITMRDERSINALGQVKRKFSYYAIVIAAIFFVLKLILNSSLILIDALPEIILIIGLIITSIAKPNEDIEDERVNRNLNEHYNNSFKILVPIILLGYILSRSEEHTSELQSRPHLVCRLLLEKKK